jgi:D-lactate dehydrogenase
MLTPHVRAIGRPAGPPLDDAVAHASIEGTPAAMKSDLIQLVGQDQVLHRISDLVRYASDASPYRYLPQVVVLPRTIDDVRAILEYSARTGRHATFRAGGTSLNGQSQSDDILIDVRRHWAGLVVEDGGARLKARPGTILGHANAVLRPLGRRLGPDPASADVATIGGVIANNAGGMRCTLERNAYHTVSSLTLVLASGTVIDTAAPDAEAKFATAEPELAAGLTKLREELLADNELAQRVRHKFAIRNTNGYALSALLDADTPLEIFRRLIVGSEGTLAFMAEAVIDTLPAPAVTTVSWIVLPSISEAAALVPGLVAHGAEAVELMLAPALAAAAQAFPGTPQYWRDLDPRAAALLVEFGADSPAGLDTAEADAARLVAGANLLHPLEFTRDEEQIELSWRVRDGLLGIVGQQRPDGTALVIEDVCFPPDRVGGRPRKSSPGQPSAPPTSSSAPSASGP